MNRTLAALPVLDSPAAQLDPRWRLAGLMILIAATAAVRTPGAAFAGLAAAVCIAFLARLPLRWTMEHLVPLLLLLLPVAIFLPLSWTATPTSWKLGPFQVVPERFHLVALIFLKATALLLLLKVVLVAAPLTTTFKAAHDLHMPGLIVQLLMLSYRHIFLLGDELARLRIALRVRAYRNRPTRRSYQTIGHLAGVLFLRGYERAERVGHAMACRGYQGRFFALTSYRTRYRDVLFVACLLTIASGMVAWDWTHSHG